mmetsp:Transcript_38208/g.120323  ORF Transcript_38208/g.120323 Transcript_38208/m.120323 type:complete len:95 (-) Transcript_38208:125-409(-)
MDGYVLSPSGTSCLSLANVTRTCASLTRCASCTTNAACVWCSNQCVPGEVKEGAKPRGRCLTSRRAGELCREWLPLRRSDALFELYMRQEDLSI